MKPESRLGHVGWLMMGWGVLNASTDTDNGAWTDCVLRPVSRHFDSWCWHIYLFYNFFNTGLCLCSVGQNIIFYLTLNVLFNSCHFYVINMMWFLSLIINVLNGFGVMSVFILLLTKVTMVHLLSDCNEHSHCPCNRSLNTVTVPLMGL